MLSICPVLPGTQVDYRSERLRVKKTDAKWRQKCQAFLLLSVDMWAQVRSQCFLAKALSKYLLQYSETDCLHVHPDYFMQSMPFFTYSLALWYSAIDSHCCYLYAACGK
jgi:hypothetical protein